MKYEYKSVYNPNVATLNELGQESWQLVATIPSTDGLNFVAILMRELSSESNK